MAEEKATNKWLGRRPKGERDTHSFNAFVAKAKKNKVGREHLDRHHRGHGL